MFDALSVIVRENREKSEALFEKLQNTTNGHESRIADLEGQIDLLKSMGSNDDGTPGILEALSDMKDQLRKEMEEKFNELLKKI